MGEALVLVAAIVVLCNLRRPFTVAPFLTAGLTFAGVVAGVVALVAWSP